MQLSDQIFQICALLKEDDEKNELVQNSMEQGELKAIQHTYIKVLANVVEGMRREQSFE